MSPLKKKPETNDPWRMQHYIKMPRKKKPVLIFGTKSDLIQNSQSNVPTKHEINELVEKYKNSDHIDVYYCGQTSAKYGSNTDSVIHKITEYYEKEVNFCKYCGDYVE